MLLRNSSRQQGVSLIELLVAVAIGSFILLGLATLAASSSRNERELSRSARQLDNARYAMQILADDIKLAGFFGAQFGLGDPDDSALTICSVGSANVNLATASAVALAANTLERDMSVPVWGGNNLGGTPSFTNCDLDHLVAGTDAISIRRAGSVGYTPATLAANAGFDDDWFVQAHPNQGVQINIGDSTVTNTGEGFFSYPVFRYRNNLAQIPARRYVNHVYYVADRVGCTDANPGVPSLRRLVFRDNTYNCEVVAEGVENMQILYGLDTDDDGVANTYVVPTANTAEQWSQVVNVRLFLLARNAEASLGNVPVKQFNLGGTIVTPADDGFKRNVYSTTTRVVNVSNRRATVEGE